MSSCNCAAIRRRRKTIRGWHELHDNTLVQYAILDSVASVLCPAVQALEYRPGLGDDARSRQLDGRIRHHRRLPGFLGHKWMDSQLEATYEGPEAVQRRNLTVTMTNELFLAQFRNWMAEMRQIAGMRPGTGACALATAMTAVAVEPSTSAIGQRRRWQQAVPRHASGRDFCLGRRALLAAGGSPAGARRAGARAEGSGESGGRRRPGRHASSSSATCATCKWRAPPARQAAFAPS